MKLQPPLLWAHFDAIRQIPRPSKAEQRVQAFLCEWAASHGFRYAQDQAQPDCGNLVVYVPGRGHGVDAPGVVIQAHTDMVCVKEEDVVHNFYTDPIQTQVVQFREENGVEKTVLMSQSTTLGADNGLGVAAAMTAALDPDLLDCPPLELLFTVDEETGLTGAGKLNPALIQFRRLLNLDTEELGEICISCAGGRDLIARWDLTRTQAADDEAPVRVYLSGLPGGHSGVQIHERRGNAILMLLNDLGQGTGDWSGMRLARLSGGTARNVIPNEAEAWLWVRPERLLALERQFNDPALRQRWQDAVMQTEAKVVCGAARLDRDATPAPLVAAQSEAILDAIVALPSGVQAWSPVVEGLVETSHNVAVLTTQDDAIELICSTRSSRDGAISQLQSAMAQRLRQSGAVVSFSEGYPGWQADPDNPLLLLAVRIFEEVLDHAPRVTAVHAGLECGVLKGHLPDLKMISFGPDIRGAHTTHERVWLDSVPPFYTCLTRLLAELANPS